MSLIFNIIQGIMKVFRKFADVVLSSAFLALYELNAFLLNIISI